MKKKALEKPKKDVHKISLTTRIDLFFEQLKLKACASDLWPMLFAGSCCHLEYMAAFLPEHGLMQTGLEFNRFEAFESDLLIVSGTISHKMVADLEELYDQMPNPKWVMALGSCAVSGGPYQAYNVVRGVEEIIPVDVQVVGCPPSPDMIVAAVEELKRKMLQVGHSRPLVTANP